MSERLLIGRSRETERLKELLLAPGPHLITVRGEAGVGKTALLEEIAKERALFRYEAADMNSRLLKRGFTSDFNQFFGRTEAEFPSWEDALKSAFAAALETGSAIAFDRFEALCGAVPGIYLCTLLLFLSARLRNPEGLSLLAIVFWAALCFLVTVLPFDRLLQLCSTAAYAALAVIGLILYGILVHNVQRRREHYDMAYIG